MNDKKAVNTALSSQFIEDSFRKMPIVAILRGVEPKNIIEIADAVYQTGIRFIEVPLNSPQPLESISILCDAFGKRCVCGAGTVTTEQQVMDIAEAGSQLCVSPNTHTGVIEKAIEQDMIPMPGVATASEAFTAYESGARYLKVFPASSYGPGHIKALLSVLPSDAKLLAVGGVGASNLHTWLEQGTSGIGAGSDLYKPSMSAEEVYKNATKLVTAFKDFSDRKSSI